MPNPTCQQTITEYFSALRAMDVEQWVSTFAPEAVSHDPVGAAPLKGHTALREFLTGIMGLFETVGLTEDQVFINGNSAAVKWTGRGVGRNGRNVTFEGVDVIDCNEDGKITLVRAFWDPGPIMAAVQS
jgi:steroid Delta-isomerase